MDRGGGDVGVQLATWEDRVGNGCRAERKDRARRESRKNKSPESIKTSLETLLQNHQLPEHAGPPLGLLVGGPRQRAAGVAAVAQTALQAGLGADDAALDGRPVSPRDDLLHLHGLGNVALAVPLDGLDARLGSQVCEPCEDAVTAAYERLQREVGGAAEHDEGGHGARRAGLGGGDDAVQLPGVAARQLDADDVGMLGQLYDGVGREVEPRDGAGVVVDDDGDGRGVGDGGEELLDGLGIGREQRRVVGRRQDQRVVAARLEGLAAVLDGLTRRLGAAADDDGEVCVAGVAEGLARRRGHGLALGVRQVYGLAVGTLGGEAGDAGPGEAYGVAGGGLEVKVLGHGIEEADGRHVDAGHERPRHVLGLVDGRDRRAVEGPAVGRAVVGVEAPREGGLALADGDADGRGDVAVRGGRGVAERRHAGGSSEGRGRRRGRRRRRRRRARGSGGAEGRRGGGARRRDDGTRRRGGMGEAAAETAVDPRARSLI